MRPVLLAMAFIVLGLAILAATAVDRSLFGEGLGVGLAAGGVFTGIGLIALMTIWSRRTRRSAFVQLDVFLPFFKKRKKNAAPPQPGFTVRLAKTVFPRSFFSDPETGKPGLPRKALKRIGPTALSAPLRRVVQTVCFLIFLWLFFYVAWPYTAAPDTPGATSRGWRLESVDNAGVYHFADGPVTARFVATGALVYVVDETAAAPANGYIAAFRVLEEQGKNVALSPRDPLPDDTIDVLLTGVGPWSLHEKEPGHWPSHYADDLAQKERIPAETFLVIDPLVSLSTAIAARSWVWSLACAAMILIVCVLLPRGFCGYLCPLGTLIDLFDWSIGRRVTRFRVSNDGWWVHIKYYLLLGVLLCAAFGVLVSGYVAAIPVITRGMLFLGEPAQSGVLREWRLVPPMNSGHIFSLVLFVSVLALGFLKPRFWCKYVCPSGAVFSLGNLFRLTERKVESSCIHCNKCIEICPFDAIKPDFTTRATDCTLCQTCGGVCPTHAIKFVERWNKVELKVINDPPTGETALGRRGFLSLAAGTAAAAMGGAGLATATTALTANDADEGYRPPVRPPGSVPEREFLQMCIRCGECFKACPNNVLQPMGLGDGLNNLWTPQVVADWAGCEPSCNACGQVCPTGAIRALPLSEKKAARMGLAIVNPRTCLPFAGREACQLCVDECAAAGDNAIEFTQVHTQLDAEGRPAPGTGFLAPVVLLDKCVGCGICQTRCYGINAMDKGLLAESAIVVEAGPGKEDRLMGGSYIQLREEHARRRAVKQERLKTDSEYFVPGGETRPVAGGVHDAAGPEGETLIDEAGDSPF